MQYRRAAFVFVSAYIAISVLAFWLYLVIVWADGSTMAPSSAIVHDRLYILSEKLSPLLNLLVWTAFGWIYFKRVEPTPAAAWRLSSCWLAVVLPLDLVVFVLAKTPLSISAHDFYVGQFPWIYLTYATVVLGPVVGAWLRRVTA